MSILTFYFSPPLCCCCFLLWRFVLKRLRCKSCTCVCWLFSTLFPGSLFSASLSCWNRDPGCDWSRDRPESGWKKNLLEGWGIWSSSRPNALEYPPTLRSWMNRWSRGQSQPGSLLQRLREAEKRDPGNEVGLFWGVFCDVVMAFVMQHSSWQTLTPN